MSKTGIIIHTGAGADSEFYRRNRTAIEKSLKEVVEAAYDILHKKGSAVNAVEAAVKMLEDNPLFNAGRGSAINNMGEVEMCASIMEGKNMTAGAVSIVHNIKNPVSLARLIMEKTDHVYMGGNGAIDLAKEHKLEMEPEAYFITEHQTDLYLEERKKAGETGLEVGKDQTSRYHGTVGAVALDHKGNVAAATSTGGTEFCHRGRIADSSMIGVGSYADNKTCAISCTGDGEYLMRSMLSHTVACLVKYKKLPLMEACKEALYVENKNTKGDMGMIAIDTAGNMCIEFNSERMPRAWKTSESETEVRIYGKSYPGTPG